LGPILRWQSKEPFTILAANYLYGAASLPAENKKFFNVQCELPETFQTWFLITQLHVWMFIVRLKGEDSNGKSLSQALLDCFFDDIEDHIRFNGITSNSLISRNMKELLSQLYGINLAYDEGLSSGNDTVLAAALWRNLFIMKGKPEHLAIMTHYVRRQLHRLDLTLSGQLLQGLFQWEDPMKL
jgi:cytochrome b pre-mRNA-processing protein 3